MSLLAGLAYDPATAVVKAGNIATAMTALDTTNLRVTFDVPESGNVLVRLQGNQFGTAYMVGMFFGVMQGATVVRRVAPVGQGGWYLHGTNSFTPIEAVFTVTGLTPAATLTWDAAYGVEIPNNNSLRYGGPNDATTTNAYGAFLFEVWTA